MFSRFFIGVVAIAVVIMLRFTAPRLCAAAITANEAARTALYSHQGYLQRRERLKGDLHDKKQRLAVSAHARATADTAAEGYPNKVGWAGFAYLVAQNAVLFNWTFIRFDWNLVEPITYLLGYSCVWLASAVYFRTRRDFTYDNLRAILVEKEQRRLYAAANIDVDAMAKLGTDIAELEADVDQLDGLRDAVVNTEDVKKL
jgi:hypothetical protein